MPHCLKLIKALTTVNLSEDLARSLGPHVSLQRVAKFKVTPLRELFCFLHTRCGALRRRAGPHRRARHPVWKNLNVVDKHHDAAVAQVSSRKRSRWSRFCSVGTRHATTWRPPSASCVTGSSSITGLSSAAAHRQHFHVPGNLSSTSLNRSAAMTLSSDCLN